MGKHKDKGATVSAATHVGFAFLAFALSCVCYYNTQDGDFVFDDKAAILSNRDSLAMRPWYEAFIHDYWGDAIYTDWSHKSYRPLTVLTFRASFLLNDAWPRGWHIANTIFHGIASFVMYYASKLVLKNHYAALLSSLFFAAHPIHTEAVANLAGRAEMLSGATFLAAFLAYVRGANTNHTKFPWVILSAFLAIVATLFKETGFTVFGIMVFYDLLMVYDVIKVFRERHWMYRSILPFVQRLIVLVLFAATFLVFRKRLLGELTAPLIGPEAEGLHRDIDNPIAYEPVFFKRAGTYGFIHSYYAWLLIFPRALSADYSHPAVPIVQGIDDPRNICTVLLYSSLVAFAWWGLTRAKTNIPAFCAASMVATFFPASNVLFNVGTVVAERVLYLPSIGYCMLISYMFMNLYNYLAQRKDEVRQLVLVACMLIIVAYSYKTIARNPDWNSELMLFKSAVEVQPNSAKSRTNLGVAMEILGYDHIALEHYETANRLHPRYYNAYYNMGVLFEKQKKFEKAIWAYKKAIGRKKTHSSSWNNLGNMYQHKRDFHQALEHYVKAIEYESTNDEAFQNTGVAYYQLAKEMEAKGNQQARDEYYSKALEALDGCIAIRESPHEPYYFKGLIYEGMNRPEEGIAAYKQSLAVNPSHFTAANNLGVLLQQQNRLLESLDAFQMSLTANPEYALAHLNKGVSFVKLQKPHDASLKFMHALICNPNYDDAYLYLSIVLQQQGLVEQADAVFNAANILSGGKFAREGGSPAAYNVG